MWWFLIYFVISYLFFTLCYFYTYNEYEFPKDIEKWKKYIWIIIGSLIVGLFWPIILILSIILVIKKTIKKK